MANLRRTPLHPIVLAAALALAPAAVVVTIPSVAHAQPTPFSQPLVELLPVGAPTADGATPVTLRFLALGLDGAPLDGLTGRVTLGAGNNGAKLEPAGQGLYAVTLTPSAAKAAGTAPVNLRAKGPSGSIDRSFTISLLPPDARRVRVSANPSELVLGQDASATLSFKLGPDADAAARRGDLIAVASAGTIANLTDLGGGRFSALYSAAPDKLFPHSALITVVDRRDPDRSFGTLSLPLKGKADFPVMGQPNSRILLTIGDREFGPIQADATGKAQVPIIVPPGVPKATVVSVLDGKRTEDTIDLQIPPTKRIQLVPTWSLIPSSDSHKVQVRAFAVRPDGSPAANANVKFSATAGSVSASTHEGGGVYVAEFTPPYGLASSQVTLQVTMEDPIGPQTDAVTLELAGARPGALALTPEPAVLPPGAQSFQLFARLTGRNGAGTSASGLRIDVAGGQQQGALKDLGNGDFQAAVTPDGQGMVQVHTTARAAASSNPLRHIVLLPAQSALRPDTKDNTAVAVLTLDEFGQPVPGVPVTLSVSAGDAALPAQVTTDDNGIGVVPLTAGQTPGAVRLQAQAGGVTGDGFVVQGPPRKLALGPLATGGTPQFQAITANWSRLFQSATIRREGGSTATVGPVATASTAAVPGKVVVVAEPRSVAPGGAVTLRVTVTDPNGRPSLGQSLQFVSNAGDVSNVTEIGGGVYTARLAVPAGTSKEVKVAAITQAGIAGLLSVPVALASPGWGAVAQPVQPAEPEPVAQPEPAPEPAPKEPRVEGEHPWLRVGGGFLGGMYSYQQTPSTQQGPLYSRSITVGGQVTSPAGATGFYVDGRAWLPMFEYVGFDASFRTARWSMNLTEGFDEPIPDWLNHAQVTALGRYPIDLDGGNRLHIAGRLGFDVNDFLYYTQTDAGDDGSFSIEYQQLPVFATSLGAELGAEVGPVFGILGYEASFSDFDGVYSNELDGEVGVGLGENLYLSGRFGWLARSTGVFQDEGGAKQEVGTLTDSLTSFGLGVGYQR